MIGHRLLHLFVLSCVAKPSWALGGGCWNSSDVDGENLFQVTPGLAVPLPMAVVNCTSMCVLWDMDYAGKLSVLACMCCVTWNKQLSYLS